MCVFTVAEICICTIPQSAGITSMTKLLDVVAASWIWTVFLDRPLCPANVNVGRQRAESEVKDVDTSVFANSVEPSFHSVYFCDVLIRKFSKNVGFGAAWSVSKVDGPVDRFESRVSINVTAMQLSGFSFEIFLL